MIFPPARDLPLFPNANCKGHPEPDIFFTFTPEAEAKRDELCPTCPHLLACEIWGIHQEYGAYGSVERVGVGG